VPEDARINRPGGASFRQDFLSAANLRCVRDLNAIAGQRGQSLVQMALAWVLRDTRVSSTLIGASNSAQIRENVGALANLAFSHDELQAIDAAVRDGDLNIWKKSSSA
jgi:L-glyceraldehyde 3-phosphate reductase